jgi:hypothetical protein
MTSWAGFGEWLHNLGWLCFWLTATVWYVVTYVHRRSLPTAITPHSGLAAPAIATPSVEVIGSYPKTVAMSGSHKLVEWRNRNAPDEGGRVELIDGSVHVEIWNRHGHNKSGKKRMVWLDTD